MGNCCRSTGAPDSRPHWSGHADPQTKDAQTHLRIKQDRLVILAEGQATGSIKPATHWFSSRTSSTSTDLISLPSPEFGSFLSTISAVPLRQPIWTSSRAYGCASFDVTNRATTIKWQGYGLKIQILDESIPQYITTARLDVSVHYISSPSYLPGPVSHDDYDHWPVSALYSIKVGSGKLCKPITIEIQHCSRLHEISILLRASSERGPFRPVIGAVFDPKTNYSKVIVPKLDFVEDQEYDDFSWFIIAIRRFLFRNTIHYKAQVYISKTTMMMHFIITMALDPCSTVVEAKYNDCDLHTSFPVQFDNDRISLDVPEGGITLENGWVITPLYHPSIAKRLVDRFCIFHNDIPKCDFSLHCQRSPPTRLEHRITLTGGTANGENHFCINFKPPHTSDVSTATAGDRSASNAFSTNSAPGYCDMTQGEDGSGESAHGSSRAASVASTMSDNPPTLPTMMRILLPVSSQWMNIGIMLSLSHGRLTAIETRCRGIPDNCLREMLNEWLQQVNSPPTKSALVSAVENYNPSLAEEISAL